MQQENGQSPLVSICNSGPAADEQQNKELVPHPALFYTVFELREAKTQGEKPRAGQRL